MCPGAGIRTVPPDARPCPVTGGIYICILKSSSVQIQVIYQRILKIIDRAFEAGGRGGAMPQYAGIFRGGRGFGGADIDPGRARGGYYV